MLLRGVVMFVQILLAAVPRLFIVWSNRCQRPWLRAHLQRYADCRRERATPLPGKADFVMGIRWADAAPAFRG